MSRKSPTNCHNAILNDAINQNPSSAFTLVFGLLFPCGPLAICQQISSIIINSVNRMLRGRSTAHIFEEQLIVVPSLAYRNASVAVIVKAPVFWIFTSSKHCSPNPIFTARRISMYLCTCRRKFFVQAPTTSSPAFPNIICRQNFSVAAIAQAQEKMSISSPDHFQNSQSSKPLSNHYSHCILLDASAAFLHSISDVIRICYYFFTAITLAQNLRYSRSPITRSWLSAPEHGQSPKAFSDHRLRDSSFRSFGHSLLLCPWLEPLGRSHVSAARLLWGK